MELSALCDGSATGFACKSAALAGSWPGKMVPAYCTLRVSMFCAEACSARRSDIRRVQRSRPSGPPKETMIASLWCDHSALGVTGGAAMRSLVIGEERQALEVQIVFSNTFISFPRAASTKNHAAAHMCGIVQTYR